MGETRDFRGGLVNILLFSDVGDAIVNVGKHTKKKHALSSLNYFPCDGGIYVMRMSGTHADPRAPAEGDPTGFRLVRSPPGASFLAGFEQPVGGGGSAEQHPPIGRLGAAGWMGQAVPFAG